MSVTTIFSLYARLIEKQANINGNLGGNKINLSNPDSINDVNHFLLYYFGFYISSVRSWCQQSTDSYLRDSFRRSKINSFSDLFY